MAQDDKVVFLDGRGAGNTGTAIRERFRELADRRLSALLRHMLDQVDDALFDRADRETDADSRTEFFSAMREIRVKRKVIEQRFEYAMGERHAQLGSGSKSRVSLEPEDETELSLVDPEKLEENLAVEAMVSRLRTQHAEALNHLCARLNVLAGRERYNEDNNPVDPNQIASAFGAALAVVETEIQARLVILKLFERHVLGQLGGLYEELNRLLADAGISADIDPPRSEQPTPPRRQPRTEITRPQAERLFDALQALLGELNVGGGASGSGTGASGSGGGQAGSGQGQAAGGGQHRWSGTGYESIGGSVNLSEVVVVLSGLQHLPEHAPGDQPMMSSEDIRRQVHSGLAQRGSGKLGALEDCTIEIVSLIFENILNDSNIPDRIKALLARLQIPMLKVALVDPSMFSKSSHPARRLLNDMARAGVGWTDNGQPAGDPLYRRMESIVNYILEEFSDDVAVFECCREEFGAFLEEERERARQIEERTRQAAEGKAKVDSARQHVDARLRQRLAGRELPEVVIRLIDEAWSKVLFITLLKEGDESEQWRNQLALVDRLIWSVEPKADHVQRKKLVSEIPALLHDLRAGLNSIMFNPVDMTRMFKELEGVHIRLLSRPMERQPKPSTTPLTAGDFERSKSSTLNMAANSPDALSPESTRPPAELMPYLEQIDEASVGTWFEFPREDDKPAIRAKLSARLSGGDRLVFVNRAGFKLADRRRDEMARALQQKRVILLDDDMLFDKALESVVSNLRVVAQN